MKSKKKISRRKIDKKKDQLAQELLKRSGLMARDNEQIMAGDHENGSARIDATPAANFNNVLTASRMNTALQCWRKHFWQCEIGLRRKEEASIALRIGSAWARAMEARWNGKTYNEALADAFPEGCMFDNYTMGSISALLAAYYDIYGEREHFGQLHPEVQFSSDLGDGWTAEGKIDGLGQLTDGRSGIIESKTTADSLAPDSGYWMRTAFNVQVYQYIVEARKLGWDVATTYYDVTRKPGLSAREVEEKDADDKKVVRDAQGNRVFNEKGKFAGEPRQSEDKEKGWTIARRMETPDEFCDRLYKDVLSRPEFYFCRREIPVIEKLVEDFIIMRNVMKQTIMHFRRLEIPLEQDPSYRDPSAWPRNVSENTCDFCPFKSFCLQDQTVDLQHPPEGFEVQSFNPELQQEKQ